MKIRAISDQLRDAMDILNDPEIIAHFGGKIRKSIWTVIERISKKEFGVLPNIAVYRTMAVEGNQVFKWIADFNQDTVTRDSFDKLIQATEAYILMAARIGN